MNGKEHVWTAKEVTQCYIGLQNKTPPLTMLDAALKYVLSENQTSSDGLLCKAVKARQLHVLRVLR